MGKESWMTENDWKLFGFLGFCLNDVVKHFVNCCFERCYTNKAIILLL